MNADIEAILEFACREAALALGEELLNMSCYVSNWSAPTETLEADLAQAA